MKTSNINHAVLIAITVWACCCAMFTSINILNLTKLTIVLGLLNYGIPANMLVDKIVEGISAFKGGK